MGKNVLTDITRKGILKIGMITDFKEVFYEPKYIS